MIQRPSVTFIRTNDLHKKGIITRHDFRVMKVTGHIGAVRGPHVVMSGRYPTVSKQELDSYLERKKEWREKYHGSQRTAEFLSMNLDQPASQSSVFTKAMRSNGVYMQIATPFPYRFENMKGVFFHVRDLEELLHYLMSNATGKLSITNSTYIPEQRIWQPNYKMPSEEEYFERYTEGTKLLVDRGWKKLSLKDQQRWRYYRRGAPANIK